MLNISFTPSGKHWEECVLALERMAPSQAGVSTAPRFDGNVETAEQALELAPTIGARDAAR
jgi:hypothetical protein